MPRKLNFRVCARSGWEDGYSGTDISTHTPLMKGWRSQRFCAYPQELVIQLGGEFHISQLQLLSHQYLITSQVELYVRSRRLGHVSMSTNEKSSFRQRELKSIHLDVCCSEIKLLLHHNHINQLNLFNQVALVAINVIGDDSSRLQSEPQDYMHVSRPEQLSRFTDLAFAINQDPSITSLILHLEKNKRIAVHKEKYKLAKRLKDCIGQLQQVGEQIAAYEVQKREAIQKEDYNLAEEKRLQSEACRQQSFKRLNLSALLTESDALILEEKSPLQQHSVKVQDAVVEFQPIKAQGDIKTTHDTPDQDFYHDNQDDRPLPTLDKNNSRLPTPSEVEPSPALHGPDALSKKVTQEATPIIKVFGVYTAQLLYSKHFQHRSEGLDSIITEVSSQTSSSPLLLKALTLAMQRLLRDKVFQVFNRCTELLLELCSSLAEKLRLNKQDLTNFIEKIGHVLLHRLGDNTPRIRQAAVKTLQQLIKLPLIKKWNVMEGLMLELPSPQSPWRQMISQIEILCDISCNPDNNIDLPLTIQFLAYCMEHIQQPVRTAAFDGLLQLYRHHGNAVRQKLSTYEEKSSIVWRNLFKDFDRIDGKPNAADIAAVKKQQEKESQEELRRLQEQHKKLKAIVKSHDPNIRSHDHMCLFCGIEQTVPMEEHYLNCAMLTYCSHCKQMVEISGLTDHLLGECEVHEEFHKCPRCGEAVHTSNRDEHTSCPMLENNKQCCPFCHSQITANEMSWKDHLMGANSCRKQVATSSLQIKQLKT